MIFKSTLKLTRYIFYTQIMKKSYQYSYSSQCPSSPRMDTELLMS